MGDFRSILPLLLKYPCSLTDEEKQSVRDVYASIGRDAFDRILIKEKQSRPFASEVLALCGCDADYWNAVHSDYFQRNTAIVEILNSVFKVFHDKGGKTLNVYENFGAVLSSGLSVGDFASGDVDFTVEPDEEQLVIDVLHENGFYEEIRSDHAKASDQIVVPFYNPKALDGKGYWLNIMRKPVARSFMLEQDRYVIRLSESRKGGLMQYKDTEIRLLEPTAMVYFNALHFACEHFYSASPGMALCCDMDRVIRTHKLDWDKLVRWSKEDKAGLRIRMALDVCHYFLKTEVPLEKFGKPSSIYLKLRHKIIDEEHNYLIPQEGKKARLITELMSDDMPMVKALIRRVWNK